MTLERLGIPGANVLGTNYTVTSLTVSDYNPNIDGTVTLTVTAKSVYGNPIEDMEIPVTASEGNFTELNGSSITGASTVTGTTDSNGEFTLTYSCSEWGLITFSAKNHNTQITVKGWKQVQSLSNGRVNVYTDGKYCKIQIGGTFVTSTSAGDYNLATIDSKYTNDSNYNIIMPVSNMARLYNVFLLNGSTTLKVNKASTSSSDVSIYCTLFYPLKTPLY